MILGGSIAIAAAATAALATQTTQPAKISDIDRKQIEQIVHDYILAHPEVLSEAADNLKARQVGEVSAKSRSAIETPYAGAWEGAAKGDVIVTENFDYACGYCRASLPDLAKLVGADAKVKVVYRELPILSEESSDAAKVSLLAAERGQYMAYHKALYGAGRVTRDSILGAATKAGISKADAEAAIASKKYDAEIQSNIALAQKLQASGTPTFVIGGQVLNGAVGYDALKDGVAAARGK